MHITNGASASSRNRTQCSLTIVRADGTPCRRALVTSSETTSSARSVSAPMPHRSSVTRVKSRPDFTDSGCAPRVQVAVGCVLADAASQSKGGAESKVLSWRVLPGLLAVRSCSSDTSLTSVVIGEVSPVEVMEVPSIGAAAVSRVLAAQALSSSLYLANARPDARADGSAWCMCGTRGGHPKVLRIDRRGGLMERA